MQKHVKKREQLSKVSSTPIYWIPSFDPFLGACNTKIPEYLTKNNTKSNQKYQDGSIY